MHTVRSVYFVVWVYVLLSTAQAVKQRTWLIGILLLFCAVSPSLALREPHPSQDGDYTDYQRIVVRAESLLADRKYEEALASYRQLMEKYDFVFLREYQMATQLALQVGAMDDGFAYLKEGIKAGWTMKSIRANRFMRKMQTYPAWKDVQKQYASLRQNYENRINPDVRKVVKRLFWNDQRKAFGALFTFNAEKQERYAEKKFAPHSEKQLARLIQIMDGYGYPGEQLIGNNLWAAVILSHHNSISRAYSLKDSLYPSIKSKLVKAMQVGQLSAYEFAMMDGWYRTVKDGGKAYGYLTDQLTESERVMADGLRSEVGLSSVETVNRLLAMQQETGIELYLTVRAGKRRTITP